MKLSEAIRAGCKYGPKILFERHGWKIKGSTCALGAAELHPQTGERTSCVEALWPWTLTCEVSVPEQYKTQIVTGLKVNQFAIEAVKVQDTGITDIRSVIAALNNYTELTREAISEFVETVERKLGLWDELVKADSPVVVEAVKASMEAVKI